MILKINNLVTTNVERCEKWRPGRIEEWSPMEWAGTMPGEAANTAKTLERVESTLQIINEPGRSLIDAEAIRVKVVEELADALLYGLSLMAQMGIQNPERVISEAFSLEE